MTDAATTQVLIVAGAVPDQQGALIRKLEQLRDLGAQITIACDFDAALLSLPPTLATVCTLPDLNGASPSRVRRADKSAPPTRRVWLRLRRNSAVRRHAGRADVLVALDQLAIYAVWELAQRRTRPQAVYGIEPALRAVSRHREHPRRPAATKLSAVPAFSGVVYRRLRQATLVAAAAVASSAVSPAIMRTSVGTAFWTAMVATPRLPDGIRGRLAYKVHVNLLHADRPAAAKRASAAAARRIRNQGVLADMFAREANAEAAAGIVDTMPDAVKAMLAIADGHLKRKEPGKVARPATRAMRLLFHDTLHADPATSPLAADPEGYLDQWRRSATVQALAAPRGRTSLPAGEAPTDRNPRLMIIVDGNVNTSVSSTEIRHRLEESPDVDVRVLDLADSEELSALAREPRRLIDHVVVGRSLFGNKVESLLRSALDWADTVLIDGCEAAAALITVLDPGNTRIGVYLPDSTLLRHWPHLVDFSRIDELVFPSAEAHDLARRLLPQLDLPQASARSVLSGPAETDTPALTGPETAGRRIGTNAADTFALYAREAVRILHALHERDRQRWPD